MPTASRDHQILSDRIRGDTLASIGERHGVSTERARVIVVKEGRRQVDDLIRRLRENQKSGAVEAYLVAGDSGSEVEAALAYLRWTLAQLDSRGIRTRVHFRPVRSGLVFGVELEDTPRRRRETA